MTCLHVFRPVLLSSVAGLDAHASSLITRGWAPRTRSGYATAVKKYLTFAESLALEPLPLTETLVLRFVAHLHLQGLAPSTIKVYLSAIRAWVISLGMKEPQIWTPRVTLACKAVARDHSPPHQALPITFTTLDLILKSLTPSHDHLMIASAITLQYFACLRASELCSNPVLNLTPARSDLSFSQNGSSFVMVYHCHSSKTASHGFRVHVGCSGSPVCAVCINHYFVSKFPKPPDHPLYCFTSGQPLTYPVYNAVIKRLVKLAGLDPSLYSSHSIRAGAATQAARSGLDPESIKRLGRWRSQAYTLYLRPPPEAYADLAPPLAPHPHS